jgi:hypothetical protein
MMCADYTDKGKALHASFSQEKIIDKYKLQAGEWNVIKDKFRLLKNQEVVPPILYARMVKKHGQDYVNKFVDMLIEHNLTVNARE